MAIALMTGRTTEEYINLFEGLKRAMQNAGLPCQPHEFILDFEAAAWGALRFSFPGTVIRGCGFHLAKCVRGKWRNLGLPHLAKFDRNLRKIYAKSQALRFLPAHKIPAAFRQIIKRQAAQLYPAGHSVHAYLQYLESYWVSSMFYPPSNWSQFRCDLRTNNDLEG